MKARYCWCLLVAATVAVPSYGAVVNAPWTPDGSLAGEKNLYEILGMANSTVPNSALQITADEVWSTGIGNQFTSLLIEMAGGKDGNTFGLYDTASANPVNTIGEHLEIFPGPENANLLSSKLLTLSGSAVSISVNNIVVSSITLAGTDFGFYLKKSDGSIFYSEGYRNGTIVNPIDQMVTFDVNSTKFGQLPFNTANTGWVLGWEDLPYAPSDKDFNDMVISLTMQPIPEPTTVIAGALLLLPFGASTLRFMRKSRTA